MNQVLEVNVEELWARVQPGLVQDELNHHVRPMGFLFGPDTSTSNRATLGGMLGNNSGGSHSIAYGLTVEHVIEIRALLADGSRGRLRRGHAGRSSRPSAASPGLEGADLPRGGAASASSTRDEIRARYPRHWRRVCGYNLNELVGFACGRTPTRAAATAGRGRSRWRASSSAPRARS